MFANGSLPYSDFFATGGFFYYFLVSLAFRLGSTLWLIPIQFLSLLSFWKLPLQDCHAHDKQEGNCHSN